MAELIELLPLTRDGRVSAREADFTAIDVKTTGLRTGRVVELGVVRVRADGTVRGELSTLVSPGCALPPGPHRINGDELAMAPSFGDVLGPLLDLCRGAVIVAHDLPSTWGFLAAEGARLGVRLPVPPGVSTMRAAQEVMRLPNYRLGTIARALGLGDYPPYLALASARVCAQVVTALVGGHGLGFTTPPRFPELPRFAPGGRILRRPDVDVVENGWMSGVVDRVVAEPSDPTVAQAYLDLLAESVGDQHLSGEEVWALAGLAADAGLAEPDVRRIHDGFVSALRAVAEADGVVTAAEGRELRQVAAALGVPEVVAGLRPTASGRVTRVLVLGTTAAADRLRARVLAEGVQLAKKLTASVTHLAHDDSVSPAEPRLARAAELGAEVVAVGEATVALGFESGAEPMEARASEGEPGWPEVEPTEVVRLPASAEVPLPQEETRRFAPVAVPAPRVEPVPRAAVSSAVPRPAPRSGGSATADPPPAGLAGAPRKGPAKVASTVAGRVMMGIGLLLMFITLAAMFGGAGVGAGIFLAVIGVGLLVGGWLVGEKGQRGGQPSVDA
jgi:DNA polymerase-3 subunit epsilon